MNTSGEAQSSSSRTRARGRARPASSGSDLDEDVASPPGVTRPVRRTSPPGVTRSPGVTSPLVASSTPPGVVVTSSTPSKKKKRQSLPGAAVPVLPGTTAADFISTSSEEKTPRVVGEEEQEAQISGEVAGREHEQDAANLRFGQEKIWTAAPKPDVVVSPGKDLLERRTTSNLRPVPRTTSGGVPSDVIYRHLVVLMHGFVGQAWHFRPFLTMIAKDLKTLEARARAREEFLEEWCSVAGPGSPLEEGGSKPNGLAAPTAEGTRGIPEGSPRNAPAGGTTPEETERAAML